MILACAIRRNVTARVWFICFVRNCYRVELLNEAEDKAKGGKDFQAVVKVTKSKLAK